MLDSLDTRIVFFGGACNLAAVEAVVNFANAGFEVISAECDPSESSYLEQADIPGVADRAEALAGAQVVLTSCARPEDVEDLYLGDDGLLEVAEPGTYLIDLSLTTPRLAQEIQAMAAVSELTFLDAPVLNVGEKEQPVCFIGGEPKAIELVSGLMPYLAPSVHPLSSPGEGQLSANMVVIALAGSLMGTIEAMAMANICGFAQRSALDALASTGAASRTLIDYIPQVLGHDFNGRVSVREFMEQLDTALLTAEDMDVTLPMTETAYQMYELLSVVGGDELNLQALALLYEDEATCAKYGLDWALADQNLPQDQDFMQAISGDGYAEDRVPDEFRNMVNTLHTQLNAMGTIGTGDAELDDYHNHHTRSPEDGDIGIPPAGNFFSKN